MVITFSNIRGSGGGGGATGGTVSGITLWSDETTKAYIDNALSGVTDVLSAYTPTSGFSTINGSAITEGGNITVEETPYSAGTNIDITDHIISVTGITIPTKVSELVNDSGYITTADTQNFVTSGDVKTQIESYNYINSGQAQTQIDNSISGKQDTLVSGTNIKTINNESILGSGNLVIEATPYSAGTGIGISEHVISVTGDYETVVELTQAEYDALTAYSENTTYIITDAPAINMSAYTPTSGFSTINGSAITEGGNITVEETPYSAGTNINIANHVISVTGITVPTKLSDLQNDEGFITTADTQNFVTSGDVKTQIEGYNYINSGQAQTQIDNSISGKMDTSAMTAYATTGWVENQGYLTTETDPIFTGSPAYGITSQDIANWNSVSGKQDTLVSGTNIKTINNESILGSGNITIQGGGGGSNIIELTQAEYDALTAYTEDAIYVITDAPVYDISNYELLSNKVTSISSASTDTQYPSAKCVYDLIGDVETLLANI